MRVPEGARGTPGQQGADLLAWELRKNYELKRLWFESERPGPDSPDWGSSLFKWHIEDRIAHMLKHGIKEVGIGRDLMQRSLSALADAAPIEDIIWDYRAGSMQSCKTVRPGCGVEQLLAQQPAHF